MKPYSITNYSCISFSMIFTLLFITVINCSDILIKNENKMTILENENLFAWCIIPYDSLNRSPIERVEMLKELGIQSYAYDWRTQHLEFMHQELEIMKQSNIKLKGVWLWLDVKGDLYFDENCEVIFRTLKDQNVKTDIWIGIPEDYFNKFDEANKLVKAVEIIGYSYFRAKEIGCTISLYNHGGWFGNPKNQIKIIEELGVKDVGIIYNFHHAHDQLDKYEENIELMKKYLRAVNINGMIETGPKILPVGEGDREAQMIKDLISTGYNGPIGILGHVENTDVRLILEKNLKGVELINSYLRNNN